MTKIILLSLLLFTQNIIANIVKEEIQTKLNFVKDDLLIGYYGRPNTASLGILGQSSIDDLIIKMKKKSTYYEKEIGEKVNVKLAFHLIYALATKDPGRDNDYILNLGDKTVMKYINAAKKEGFAVIIDLQMGTQTAQEAVQPVLKYLQYDNVHLALDPEFKIPSHRRYPPGRYIGHIFADELNKAQEKISNYLLENKIKGKRNLMVHMFHKRMLRKKEEVKNYEAVNLIYNIDGHGQSGAKIKIYNSLFNEESALIADSGFKIFNVNDSKPLMTPKQILGFEAIGSRIIQRQPAYINYQ